MSEFNNEPRNYALELVENGLTSSDHLLLCCLKYMSHDDVKGMLEANDLGPNHCDDCECEIDDCENRCPTCEFIYQLDDESQYDTEGMKIDIENGNFDIETDDVDDYQYETIITRSFINGQHTQARRQCQTWNVDYDTALSYFKKYGCFEE